VGSAAPRASGTEGASVPPQAVRSQSPTRDRQQVAYSRPSAAAPAGAQRAGSVSPRRPGATRTPPGQQGTGSGSKVSSDARKKVTKSGAKDDAEEMFHSLEKKSKKRTEERPGLLEAFSDPALANKTLSPDVLSALSALKTMGKTMQPPSKKLEPPPVQQRRTSPSEHKGRSTISAGTGQYARRVRSASASPPPHERAEEDGDEEALRAEIQELEAEKARLEWMVALQLPEPPKGQKAMCMNGCSASESLVTHVCRQCASYLCKFCMSEHMVDRYTRSHDIGTWEELRLSRLKRDGWDARGVNMMGLSEDETLKNLSRTFTLAEVHKVVNGELIKVKSKCDGPAPEEAGIERLSSGASIERVSSSSSSATISSSVSKRNSGAAGLAAQPLVVPQGSDFVKPPKRPISPLFRDKGRSVSPVRDKQLGPASCKLSSAIDSHAVAAVPVESGEAGAPDGEDLEDEVEMNFFDKLPEVPAGNLRRCRGMIGTQSFRERGAMADGGSANRQDATDNLVYKGQRAFLQSDKYSKSLSSRDSLFGRTRSSSPLERVGLNAAQMRAGSMSPSRVPTDRDPGSVGRFLSSLGAGEKKPMSEMRARPSQDIDETEQDGNGQIANGALSASAQWASLRRATAHLFINEQMETHGVKSFFELRHNIAFPGAKMFLELGERHLLVSEANDITRPTYKIHLLELSAVARPDKITGLPPLLLIHTMEEDPKDRQLWRSTFENGRAFFCFKDMSEVRTWSERIRQAMHRVAEMPSAERFEEGELDTKREPEVTCTRLSAAYLRISGHLHAYLKISGHLTYRCLPLRLFFGSVHQESDLARLHSLKTDGPLAKFNGSLATVVELCSRWTAREWHGSAIDATRNNDWMCHSRLLARGDKDRMEHA